MDFDQAVAELDLLVDTLERDGDERALLLLEYMDAIHRPAIERLLAGDKEDPTAAAVLAMYGFVALDEHAQAEEALDEIRPYMESHGGGLELLRVEGGTVYVRMQGSCDGCAASAMTLQRGVETKLRERLVWFEELVAEAPEPAEEQVLANALPVLQIDPRANTEAASGSGSPELLQIAQLKRPVFADVGLLADLEPGQMTVAQVEGSEILVLNVEGEPYAFRNVCPTDGRNPLDGGRLTGSVLVCPWHNCAYDARSGQRADNEIDKPGLAVVPIAVSDGVLRVAANVA